MAYELMWSRLNDMIGLVLCSCCVCFLHYRYFPIITSISCTSTNNVFRPITVALRVARRSSTKAVLTKMGRKKKKLGWAQTSSIRYNFICTAHETRDFSGSIHQVGLWIRDEKQTVSFSSHLIKNNQISILLVNRCANITPVRIEDITERKLDLFSKLSYPISWHRYI